MQIRKEDLFIPFPSFQVLRSLIFHPISSFFSPQFSATRPFSQKKKEKICTKVLNYCFLRPLMDSGEKIVHENARIIYFPISRQKSPLPFFDNATNRFDTIVNIVELIFENSPSLTSLQWFPSIFVWSANKKLCQNVFSQIFNCKSNQKVGYLGQIDGKFL